MIHKIKFMSVKDKLARMAHKIKLKHMKDDSWRVRWIGRETVRCEMGDLACDVTCVCDPDRNAFQAVLSNIGIRRGESFYLSAQQLVQIEQALRGALQVKRFLGIPIGKREVYVQREQHVF
jgi:hypothetical protein